MVAGNLPYDPDDYLCNGDIPSHWQPSWEEEEAGGFEKGKLIHKTLDELTTLRTQLAEAQAALGVSRAIGDTFWAALKPLGLQAINVMNPGQHVTDLITQLEAERTAREAAKHELREYRKFTHCAYCGAQFRADCEDASRQASKHVKTCENHPMRQVERERDDWKAAFDLAKTVSNEQKTALGAAEARADDLQRQLDEAKCLLSHRVEADRLSEANQRIAELERALSETSRRNVEYIAGQQATIERLQGFVEDIAECDCSYGDNCPTFGANHYRCESCKARMILAATPQPEPDTRKWGICLPSGFPIPGICEDTEEDAWGKIFDQRVARELGYYAARVDDEKETGDAS